MSNKVELSGGLVKDAEIVGNPNKPVVKFRVVTTETWTDRQTQEKKEAKTGHNVVVFGWKAKQIVENYDLFRKGALVSVKGKLNYSKADSGQWFTQIEVSDSSPQHEVNVLHRFKSAQNNAYQQPRNSQQPVNASNPAYQQPRDFQQPVNASNPAYQQPTDFQQPVNAPRPAYQPRVNAPQPTARNQGIPTHKPQ